MLPLPPDVADGLDALLERALAEDVGPGDVTTLATVPADRQATARFLAKEPGVLAGLAVAERVFARMDPAPALAWTAADGDAVAAGDVFGEARGSARSLLTAERLALNLLQRMSGVATAAHRMAGAARPAIVLDTRKTAPGLRALDKWAVRLGGAANHRVGLYDMVLVKDNHIAAAGGVEAALRAVEAYASAHAGARAVPVEVEARTLEEVDEVLRLHAAGLRVDRLLLDNMARRLPDGALDTSLLREAVRRVGGRVETEASGNVTLETAPAIAATGVDFISSGALTHSVRALDVSLDLMLDRG
jgi:nicotinate-nucleotide pyrophosphorylase (carboxylating)